MTEQSDFEQFTPLILFIITLFGGFLRALMLGVNGMWLDETFSVWLSSHNVADMLQWIVKIDQHPPLYYLLLHYWIGLNGDTPYYARLLSVLFGTATIPVIYLIGKRLSGAIVGLAAALILAVSTFHIYYAQETRMYTLLTFNAAVAIYALVRLLTDPRSTSAIGFQFREYLNAWRTPGPVEPGPVAEFTYKVETPTQTRWRAWISRHRWFHLQAVETDLAWVVFIVFSAATLLSHNTAVFFILATNIYVLGLMLVQRLKKPEGQPAFQAPSFWNWVKAQVGILILWSPWLLPFIRQSIAVDRQFWIPAPTWEAVLQVLRTFLYATSPYYASQVQLIWGIYGLVLVLGLLYFRNKLSQITFLAVLFATPFLGELVVSLRRPIFLDRTLIWTTIPLFLLLAAGIAQLKFRFLVVCGLGVLVTLGLFSSSDYFRFFSKEDWNTPAGYVAYYVEKGDLVLFNSNFVEIPFNYYFKPYEEQYSIRLEKHGVPLDLIQDGVLEPRMTVNDVPALTSLISKYDRVWLVYSHDFYTDPLGLVPQTIGMHKKFVQKLDFYGGVVQLYANP